MRLIDDNHRPGTVLQCLVHRIDGQYSYSSGLETGDLELLFKFVSPLANKQCGHKDRRRPRRFVKQELTQDDARLDCFPEADFIAEQIALDRILQNAPDSFHLVGKQSDARRKQSGHSTSSCTLAGEGTNEAKSLVMEVR